MLCSVWRHCQSDPAPSEARSHITYLHEGEASWVQREQPQRGTAQPASQPPPSVNQPRQWQSSPSQSLQSSGAHVWTTLLCYCQCTRCGDVCDVKALCEYKGRCIVTDQIFPPNATMSLAPMVSFLKIIFRLNMS